MGRSYVWVGAALGASTAPLRAALAQAPQGHDWYGPAWHGGWFGMFFGPLMMIVFIAVIVVLAVLAVRWLGGAGHGPAAGPRGAAGKTPLEILEERFARGEIDKDEFEERRSMLRG
ncbi:MAG: SHOCT domain-containing protein [Kiloniellaceae bacterium]